jgi:hypothetical protein
MRYEKSTDVIRDHVEVVAKSFNENIGGLFVTADRGGEITL